MSQINDKGEAARALEAYFLRRMLSEVKAPSFSGQGFSGATFQDMLNESLADEMARAGGLGLARMIEKQLPAGEPNDAPPAPTRLRALGAPDQPSTGGPRVGRIVDGERVFSGRVENLRGKVEALSQKTGIPAEYMLAWINHESGGNVADTTHLNERGLFQIMGPRAGVPIERTEAGSLGLSDEDHRRLSTDVDYSLEQGSRMILRYRDKADAAADKNGFSWSETDMWRLTKFFHTGPGFVKDALGDFQKNHGRGPASWGELYQATTPELRARMEAPSQIGGVLQAKGLRRYAELTEIK